MFDDVQQAASRKGRLQAYQQEDLQVHLLIIISVRMEDASRGLEGTVADLLLASGRLMRKLRAVSNARELTWSQVAVMARLEAVGPMTIADLARAECVRPQSMGATLAALADEALVDRCEDPADGRRMLYALTPAGLAVRNAVGLAKHDWLLAAISKLGDEERRALVSTISTIQRLSDL